MRLTRQQRVRQAAQMLRLRHAAEARMAAAVERELTRAVVAASEAYPRWTRAMPQHLSNLTDILIRHVRQVAAATAHHVQQQHRERKLDTSEELDARVSQVVAARARHRAIEIERTTRTRVFNAVERGLQAHDAPMEIARAILNDVGGMSAARARTIARTETAVAQSTAQQVSMESVSDELGLKTMKVWTSTSDDRTRESHAAADGQRVALDDAFVVGGAELLHPSDPDGPPEETVNCRCVVVYEAT